MPASLSDATSTQFVGCSASDVLAPGGALYGYQIGVGLSALSIFDTWPPTMADAVHQLWLNLLQISNFSLAPQSPEPVVETGFLSRFTYDAPATISARTLHSGANL